MLHHASAHLHAPSAPPPTNPNLVSCDYHVLTPFEEILAEHSFTSDDEVKETVAETPKKFLLQRNE